MNKEQINICVIDYSTGVTFFYTLKLNNKKDMSEQVDDYICAKGHSLGSCDWTEINKVVNYSDNLKVHNANQKQNTDPLISKLLTLMDEKIKSFNPSYEHERALYYLLKDNEKYLPPLDDMFHQSFRQKEITKTANTELAIWHLIHHSEIFWEVFNKLNTKNAKKEAI